MYLNILAPLDGSDFAECALAHVSAIATGCSVPNVTLLRVVEPLPQQAYAEVSVLMADADKKMEAESQDYLSRTADKLKQEGLAVETAILVGRAADEILGYASQNQVDLIIMSTHGRSGISRWVMGSVADRVLRHSAVPVLIIAPAGCRIS